MVIRFHRRQRWPHDIRGRRRSMRSLQRRLLRRGSGHDPLRFRGSRRDPLKVGPYFTPETRAPCRSPPPRFRGARSWVPPRLPAPRRGRRSRRQLAQPWARLLFRHLERPAGDGRSRAPHLSSSPAPRRSRKTEAEGPRRRGRRPPAPLRWPGTGPRSNPPLASRLMPIIPAIDAPGQACLMAGWTRRNAKAPGLARSPRRPSGRTWTACSQIAAPSPRGPARLDYPRGIARPAGPEDAGKLDYIMGLLYTGQRS